MNGWKVSAVPVFVTFIALLPASTAAAASEELGNGFRHHGVATPVSNHRGTVCTVDGDGRNVVLVWLFDHRGGYALLVIDADTGHSREVAMPFAPGGDCPYSSILSTANKFYTHFNSHFVEFDPGTGQFTFCHRTAPQMAMSMTEDDCGVIWSVTYPSSGLVSFHPATRAFKDFGHLHKENWLQYPRSIAADDQGWIYFAIGSTLSHILAFDPHAALVREVVPADGRVQGSGFVCRDLDGSVYGHLGGDGTWYRFHGGIATKIDAPQAIRRKPIITDSQGLFHREFPNGDRLAECDLVDRRLVVIKAGTGEHLERSFDYNSEGAHIMGLAAAPDGTICGGTAFPMRFFSYHPRTDQWINRASYSQWNTVARQGDHFFVGGYPSGFLLQWDPAQPWVATEIDNPQSNPRFLTQATPDIYRPHVLLPHPDGQTLVLGGTPAYGYTGGGLLFWDRATQSQTLVRHTELIAEHSTAALVALDAGKLLGGTTTAAGTGGERKAQQAELYILDMATRQIEWHQAVFPGVQEYTALCPGPRGVVYGITDRNRFFVFDPSQRAVLHEDMVGTTWGPTVSQQGPRPFVVDDRGTIYLLFVRGIARVDPDTYALELLTASPVPIGPGGDYLDGRIYFGSGSHLYSWAVPQSEP